MEAKLAQAEAKDAQHAAKLTQVREIDAQMKGKLDQESVGI